MWPSAEAAVTGVRFCLSPVAGVGVGLGVSVSICYLKEKINQVTRDMEVRLRAVVLGIPSVVYSGPWICLCSIVHL
jgi:hypothetical protein